MPYNIFLIPYNKNNKRNLNNNDNNRINNIDENNQIIDKNNNNSIKNDNNNNIINDYNNIINNDNNNIINNNIINNINDDIIIIPNNDNINNKNIALINNYLLKFACCYNEIGDYFSIDESNELSYNFFNILCIGRTGAGKSTFINTFFNDRKTIIGEGNISKTHRINFYSDQINHIRIYDTIGFEDDDSANKIIDLLQKLNVELVNCKNKIHLILYFIIEGSTFFKNVNMTYLMKY